jgi:hypothetical protein
VEIPDGNHRKDIVLVFPRLLSWCGAGRPANQGMRCRSCDAVRSEITEVFDAGYCDWKDVFGSPSRSECRCACRKAGVDGDYGTAGVTGMTGR